MSGTERIGVVAGRAVPAAVLDARLASLREGPLADRLPPPDCLAGRQLRRWLAQLVLTEELVRAVAAGLGVVGPVDTGGADTGGADPDPADVGAVGTTDTPDAGRGLASAVLAGMPLARAVYRRVTREVRVGQERVRDYYRRNTDLWYHPERRDLRHVLSNQPPDRVLLAARGTRWSAGRAELPEPLARSVFAAEPGSIVGPVNTPFGWHLCLVEGVRPAHTLGFDAVRDEITARLTRSARVRYFERWLEQRRAELVTVDRGCEHPGDPRHSDYTHHH